MKGKGTKKRYIQLNAEFQRIARKGKKTLSDQCQETEENHRMGKTRNLFKKIRDTKGKFHVKMGSIKERNSKNLTERQETKKRWQEYTEELYKMVGWHHRLDGYEFEQALGFGDEQPGVLQFIGS